MELDHWRYNGGEDATLGLLFERVSGYFGETRRKLCYLCEDEFRAEKIRGETRIPAGRYRILLRTAGGMHDRYLHSFGSSFHKGMLWLQDVPGFEWIYYHIGNDDDDTYGCPLVGLEGDENTRSVSSSRMAYKEIYPRIAGAIESGEEVWVTIVDLDRPLLPPAPR